MKSNQSTSLRQLLVILSFALPTIGHCVGANEIDWNRFCLNYVNVDQVNCYSRVMEDVHTTCSVPIELKELATNQIGTGDALSVTRTVGYSAGVFDLIGIGFVVDGPTAIYTDIAAHNALSAEIDAAKQHLCDGSSLKNEQ